MNIFALDKDPQKAAQLHCDKHVVKMILEYAQLLSTAHRVLDGNLVVGQSASGRKNTSWILSDNRNNILYKATHNNHPSAIWTRQSRDNYAWLWKLLDALCKEYTHRYIKVHKVEREGLLEQLRFVPSGIAEHPIFTEPTPAMPDMYKVSSVVESYRNYYRGDKRKFATWKNRNVPEWF